MSQTSASRFAVCATPRRAGRPKRLPMARLLLSSSSACAGAAFAAQFFVARILVGTWYGVIMLRAVLALDTHQVGLERRPGLAARV